MARDINLNVFYDELMKLLDNLYDKEKDNIAKAAKVCSDAIAKGGVVHVFGSGHSIGFGMEMKGRPGALVPIHHIDMSDFVIKGMVTYADFRDQDNIFERRPHIADKLYALYDIRPEDVFIIISNSGINGVVIDMAITAKNNHHPVIVVTSWQHTSTEESRHPSGKHLYEFGDVVIDNCGPKGDALLETGRPEKVCSVSSITGAFIAQSINLEIVRNLEAEGKEVPLVYDFTVEGYKEHNQALLEKYKGRI